MTTAGSFDAPIEIFGGLVTDLSPSELPHGVSPDCQDVVFSNSGVETRPGLQALFGPFAGNPTINYIKTYETRNATLRAMALDSSGMLYKETTPGTLTSIATGLAQNSYGASTTIFGREYLAVSDGRTGNDLPRQYDDSNFDRVSQTGPGGAPTVVDENVIVAVAASPTGATQPAAVAIAVSPTGATENGFLVTITTGAAHGLSAGQSVTIAGVAVAGYNGTFPVVATPSTTQFTYIAGASGLAASGGGTASSATATITTSAAHGLVVGQLVTTTGIAVAGYNGTFPITSVPSSTQFTFTAPTGGLAASGGGTAAAAGSVSAGVHQVCVMFQTRQGYLTKPGPAASWTASGAKRAVVTNIPTGPSNVIARILCFTGAGGASFFYTGSGGTLFSGNMIISDNTTTSLIVDFSDAVLLAGTNVDNVFRLVELGDCAGVIDYNERLFWWGERNRLDNLVNLGFDGGFTGPSLPHYPLGWTPDPVYAPGGTDEENFVVWGAAYSIVGNGTTPTRGLITQTAVADSLGAQIIQANTDFTVRARCARNSTLSAGTLHVHLYSQRRHQHHRTAAHRRAARHQLRRVHRRPHRTARHDSQRSGPPGLRRRHSKLRRPVLHRLHRNFPHQSAEQRLYRPRQPRRRPRELRRHRRPAQRCGKQWPSHLRRLQTPRAPLLRERALPPRHARRRHQRARALEHLGSLPPRW